MSEEAAIYRLDAAEERGRADALEDLYRKVSIEANQLRLKVRLLEDAILMHKQGITDPCDHDFVLWEHAPWT